jgi:thiol-disulfide isomerase/thioredoxin
VDDIEDLPTPTGRERAWRIAREIGATVALGALLLVLVGWMRAPDLPDRAPDFTLRTVDGETVSLSSLEGKTVVLNFWATWCGPCRMEAPTLSAFADAHPEVVVLGVAQDPEPAVVRRGVRDLGITYPVVMGTEDVLRTYQISTFPTTVFVRPDGSVRWVHTGLLLRPQLAWLAGEWW